MLMKRLCLLLMLGLASTMAFGVKSYVYIKQDGSGTVVRGDIPDGLEDVFPRSRNMGDIINTLGNMGYVLDKFDLEVSAKSYSSSNTAYMQNEQVQVAIMSRDGESDEALTANVTTGTTSPASGTNVNAMTRASGEDATEIARYNLLGQKINGAEAGVQIIVYSDYSTKTIINE